jgi:ketosteroid isomerase-like protein
MTGLITISANSESKIKEIPMNNVDKIIEVVQNMSAAMHRGNLDDVMIAYEPGATLVAQPGLIVSGPAFKEAMGGYVSMKPNFDMPKHEVIEAGDLALHISPWTMEAVDPATGKLIRQSGFSLAVFRKQKDGRWLIVIDNPYGGNLLSK